MSEAADVATQKVPAGASRAVPVRTETRAARSHAKPDPRPSRLAVGVGALATLSVIAAGIGRWPSGGADVAAASPAEVLVASGPVSAAAGRQARVEQPIRYVRLKPGEKAPPGAKVIREKAPAPRVVVRWVSSSPTSDSTRRTPVARTRQSG